MEWIISVRNESDKWLTPFIPGEDHCFRFILPQGLSKKGHWHNRSQRRTPYSKWLEVWKQSGRIFQESSGSGIITRFPQMATCIGLRQRFAQQSVSVVAWNFNLGRCYPGLERRIAQFALKNINLFVVHSRGEREIYSQWLALPLERFEFVPLSPPEIPIRWTEETTYPFLLAMGSANRDYATLFEAIRKLNIRTIVVTGQHVLKRLPPIPPSVEVISGLTLSECHDLVQQAYLNIVPISNPESASGQRTVVDAMSMGRAIIATNCLGIRDYIQDGKTGILIKPNSVNDLIQAIHLLWNNQELRDSIRKSAKQYSTKYLSHEAVGINLKNILDSVADKC